MSDLISRSVLLKALEQDKISICSHVYSKVNPCDADELESELEYLINNQPTVDVVEVVRCKDCKYFEPIMYRKKLTKQGSCELDEYCDVYNETDFCSYGERK